nr:fusion protein [Cannabis sativa amalgavirus 1]
MAANRKGKRVLEVATGVDPLKAVDWNAELGAHLEILGAHNFPVRAYSAAAIRQIPMTVEKFIKTVKIFTSMEDEEMRGYMVAIGTVKGYFLETRTATCRHIVEWCEFLRSKEGQKMTRDRAFEAKLRRKAPVSGDIRSTAKLSTFQQMITDHSQTMKQSRAYWEGRLKKHMMRYNRAKVRMEQKFAEIDAEFAPAGEFVQLSGVQYTNACIDMYKEQCIANGVAMPAMSDDLIRDCETMFGNIVRENYQEMFLRDPAKEKLLDTYLRKKIMHFNEQYDASNAETFVATWQQSVAQKMLKFPLSERAMLMESIPVGRITKKGRVRTTQKLVHHLMDSRLGLRQTEGIKLGPAITSKAEKVVGLGRFLSDHLRLHVIEPVFVARTPSIPHSRSKFEAGVRKIIGGGEMRNWHSDSGMYRGGGNLSDALKLLLGASVTPPERYLSDCFNISKARDALQLPSDLAVPSGPEAVRMKNFNGDATAGPVLRRFGIKRKEGMKAGLEKFAWSCYEQYVGTGGDASVLPFVLARVGYRTKLLTQAKAMEKIGGGEALGRCVMMLDAYEQAFSSPLYNVLQRYTSKKRFDRDGGFRNTIVRASSDWMHFWDEVKESACIVELDWKKFDRERPAEDIEFMIQVILSCFAPKSDEERLLLEGYGVMLRRSLIERLFVMDDQGVFGIDGMVPSGSLWTGWLDTALNILYLRAVLSYCGLPKRVSSPKCAGDDNLTLFRKDVPDETLLRIRELLNSWFRAGIEEEDFIIHRPPFFVTRLQACFPPGTDLSKGTSKLLDSAEWVPFDGELVIDQRSGRSHRWKYVFEGKPKFLSCYWLENGYPIRPTYINAEKLLFPEGVHSTLEEYEAAVISMVVDNPFNQHNVNHMMHRFVICQQIKRMAVGGIKTELILSLSKYRQKDELGVPFPQVASWRRIDGYVDMRGVEHVATYMDHFEEFMRGVTSLYTRKAEGGFDAWKFMEVLRGESGLGEGQFGNDVLAWIDFMRQCPLARYLKPLRQFRKPPDDVPPSPEIEEKFSIFRETFEEISTSQVMSSVEEFALFVSKLNC